MEGWGDEGMGEGGMGGRGDGVMREFRTDS